MSNWEAVSQPQSTLMSVGLLTLKKIVCVMCGEI